MNFEVLFVAVTIIAGLVLALSILAYIKGYKDGQKDLVETFDEFAEWVENLDDSE